MIEYTITAPVKTYERRLLGVDFKNGVGKTFDEKTAQWFSGRDGFEVSGKAVLENEEENKNTESAKEETHSEQEPQAAKPRSRRQNK